MHFNKHPLVPVAVCYIGGLIFARYFYIPLWLPVFLAVWCLVALASPVRQPAFFICVFILGYFFYRVSLHYSFDLSFHCRFLKENIRGIILFNIPPGEEKDILAGLFLGERFGISDNLMEILRRTNTIHILAISGLHVGCIGIMLLGVLRLVLVPRKAAALLSLLGVILYVSVVGWRAPTFRATVMFAVLVFGWVIDRPVDMINSLALAALVILILTPQELFSAGFQLSFVIVLGLLLAAPLIKGFWLKKALWGSATAWLGSVPLVAYYFGIISPIAILANLVVVPGITVVIALGFASILAGNICLAFAGIMNAANYFLVYMLIMFLKFVYAVPGGYFYIKHFQGYMVWLAYAAMGGILYSLFCKKKVLC